MANPTYDCFTNLTNQILKIKKENKNICIYGYGNFGRYVHLLLSQNIVGIVDKNYSQFKIDLNIVSPDDIKQIDFEKILVCALGYEKEILDFLIKDLKVENKNILTFNYNHKIKKDLVIVQQMGKVASTSIWNAVKNYGFESYHCHYLSNKNFDEHLKRLLNVKLSEKTFMDQKIMFNDFLDIRRKVMTTNNVKVITLARKTEDWYWSSLVQDYLGFIYLIREYYIEQNIYFETELELLDFYYSEVLKFIQEFNIKLKSTEKDHIEKLMSLKNSLNKHIFLFIESLIYQLHWLDIEISDFYNISLYDKKLIDDSLILKNKEKEILILKYETLDNLHATIKNFLGLSEFVLEKVNISDKKIGYENIQSMKNKYNEKLMISLEIKSNKYYKFFNYQ